MDFFVERARVRTARCPQEPPSFDECLPGDTGPVKVRRLCQFGSDCGGFQEASYEQRLQEQLTAVDESAPSDEYGEAGWRVYAYADAQREQNIPAGAIATAIVKGSDGAPFRQVMFIAIAPAGNVSDHVCDDRCGGDRRRPRWAGP